MQDTTIPLPINETQSNSSQTILPLLAPSFGESSSNINQIPSTIQEKQQSSESIKPQTISTNNEYINPRGIRFTTVSPTNETVKGTTKKLNKKVISNIFLLDSLTPYGWPCVRGILRFLTTLINNYEKLVYSNYLLILILVFFCLRNNTEYMISVGLNLLTVALEVRADYLANYPLLLSIVKDSLCRNLLSVRFLYRITCT